MEKRQLGQTDLVLSILGFGGFHLIETASSDAELLLNTYLDRGGNYIETAPSYGDGISERKIGRAVSRRRREFFLASKSDKRTRKETARQINGSLKNLQTDSLDILFLHAVQTDADVDRILGKGGSLEAALEARKAGKIRYIGVSGHGQPDALLRMVREAPVDVLMTGFNYLDRFNFPEGQELLIPLCVKKGIGLMGMKALADGYLYRSPRHALRYAMSLPLACVVAGMNRMDLLELDLETAENFLPLQEEETEELKNHAAELGDYVCRLCGKCADKAFDPRDVFLLEGMFDRQMDSRRVEDTPDYALRERLKHWFGQADRARAAYAALPEKVDPEKDYSALNALCPYHIDIDRKLKIVHDKLGGSDYLY